MKKFGFTLAEVLIALGVIGVVAAITAPTLTNITPDKNKLEVLKIYSILEGLNNDLLEDISLYYPTYDSSDKVNCQGFSCTAAPLDSDYNSYSGANKYHQLVMSKLEIIEGSNVASGNTLSFKTIDGKEWTMTYNPPTGEAFGEDITIDFDSGNTSSCSYSSGCSKPTKFKFFVDTYGKIVANDHLTQAYLDNPDKLNDKKNDFAKAKAAVVAEEEALENAQ